MLKVFLESKIIDPASIGVQKENVLKGLGIPDGQADDYLMGLIDELIGYCLKICTPKAAVNIADSPVFTMDKGLMTIEGFTFCLDKMVTSALSRSTSIAFFAGTCGERTGQYSSGLFKEGQALEGLIVDLIGSEIAEGVAGYVHNLISSEMAALGMRTTNRYSPGYCNWPVSDQKSLFALLNGNNCGIQLTPSSLMLPVKSVSGIVGLGLEVVNRGYACALCDADHCLYRERQ